MYYKKNILTLFKPKLLFVLLHFSNNIYAANYYWVGGNGNWSDINHWAQSSGGTSLHTVVPQITDNVIFDNNSGILPTDSVKVDAAVATCKNLIWTSNNTMQKISGSIIHVYGSLILQNNTLLGSQLVFKSNNNETITTNNATIKVKLSFDGNGNWILNDPLNSMENIEIIKGNLNCNSKNVTAKSITGSDAISININNCIITVESWSVTGFSSTVATYKLQLL